MDINESAISLSPAGFFEDDEVDTTGRILSDAEYSRVLSVRSDIFRLDQDRRLRNIVLACLIFGIGAGMYMSTCRLDKIRADFIDKMPAERTIIIIRNKVVEQFPQQKEKDVPEKIPTKIRTDARDLKTHPKHGAGGNSGGGGNPLARVTRSGVLGILSGKINGHAFVNADIFGKGGFTSGLDGILSGLGGLKSGGTGGVGRKSADGIGFGPGIGSGFGGGPGSVDDIMNGLMASPDIASIPLKNRGRLEITEPKIVNSGQVQPGTRSRVSIMRVVMQNIMALRYAYNKRLREKPGLKGKITCKFAIDEFGRVIFCDLLGSTIADPELENEVREKISKWVFEKIDKPGDVTEVEYPFVFSQ
jgi:hypothetical protein